MRLKLINTEQGAEITRLKGRVAAGEKELEAMTIQCKTFRCVIVGSDIFTTDTLLCAS